MKEIFLMVKVLHQKKPKISTIQRSVYDLFFNKNVEIYLCMYMLYIDHRSFVYMGVLKDNFLPFRVRIF